MAYEIVQTQIIRPAYRNIRKSRQ